MNGATSLIVAAGDDRRTNVDSLPSAIIDRRYPLAEIVAALREVHEGRNRGKVVITV